jgi:hypothetical protein
MKSNPMPVGNPYYFEGNVLEYFNKINFNYPSDLILNGDKKAKLKSKSIYDYLNEIFEVKFKESFNLKLRNFLNLNNTYLKSGILCNKDNLPFGFFEVEIETPGKNEINHPILLKKHKSKFGGYRTIAPVGK